MYIFGCIINCKDIFVNYNAMFTCRFSFFFLFLHNLFSFFFQILKYKKFKKMSLTEMEPLKIHLDALEMAGKMVDKHITADSNFPSLINLMRYNIQGN